MRSSAAMSRAFTPIVRKNEEASYEEMKKKLKSVMEKNFRPEFLNRLDDIIVFRSLNDADLANIIDIELVKVSKRLAEKRLKLVVTDEAKALIREKGTNKDYGARPLRRSIEQMVEDPLAELLLQGAFIGKDLITARVIEVEGEKKLDFESTSTTPEPMVVAAVEGK